jgi:hypothetical protein
MDTGNNHQDALPVSLIKEAMSEQDPTTKAMGGLHSAKITSPSETPFLRRGSGLQKSTNSRKTSTFIFGKSQNTFRLAGFDMKWPLKYPLTAPFGWQIFS